MTPQNSGFTQFTFTRPDALGPRMIEIWITGIPTVLEPRTAASTTAASAGFLGSTAFRAYETSHI